MNEEELFCKLFPEYAVNGKPLSPYFDLFESGFEQAEKRIAELKADNVEWEKASDKWKSVYEITNNQLTKAKELLAKWVELFKPKVGNIPPTPIQVDTEQFLKEIEK